MDRKYISQDFQLLKGEKQTRAFPKFPAAYRRTKGSQEDNERTRPDLIKQRRAENSDFKIEWKGLGVSEKVRYPREKEKILYDQ